MTPLPNPGMDFTAFSTLPAAELDKMVENIEALSTGSGFATSANISTDTFKASRVFGVWKNNTVTIGGSTWTKVVFNEEQFDPANMFDLVTNSRLIAPVDGYYQINARVGIGSAGVSSTAYAQAALYKNGGAFMLSERRQGTGNSNTLPRPSISETLKLDAGDYIELFAFCSEASRDIVGGLDVTHMNGFFVGKI